MYTLVVTACITLSTQCFTAQISQPQPQVACEKELVSLAGYETITYITEDGKEAEAYVYRLDCVEKGTSI